MSNYKRAFVSDSSGPYWGHVPKDDTIKQITQGDKLLELAWTPQTVGNVAHVEVCVRMRRRNDDPQFPVLEHNRFFAGLFKTGETNCLGCGEITTYQSDEPYVCEFSADVPITTLDPITFQVRGAMQEPGVNPVAAPYGFNSYGSGNRKHGGKMESYIEVDERTVSGSAPPSPPVATDDSTTATKNTAKQITAASLLANDSGAGSITAVSNAVNCAVVLNGANVDFTPATDFLGAATFDYTVTNAAGADVGTVTVTVSEAPSEPAWTTLVAGDWQGDPASATLGSGTVTLNAADKNIRTADSLIAASEDFDFEATVGAIGTIKAFVGFCDNGTATGVQQPTYTNAALYGRNAGTGVIGWCNDSDALEGAAKAAGWMASKTIRLSRRGSTVYGLIDGVLDRTFSIAASAAGKFFLGNGGGTAGAAFTGLRYRKGAGLPAI